MTEWNVLSAHKRLTEYLQKHGVDAPRISSEILISHSLGIREFRYTWGSNVFWTKPKWRLSAISVNVLPAKSPPDIVGETAFLAHTIRTRPGVFIPRPETEILADYCIRRLMPCRDPLFLEIGSGTGAIAVSILKAVPESHCIAIDISPDAASLTLENANALGVADRIVPVVGDLLRTVSRPDIKFDAIISNPRTYQLPDIVTLEPIVRNHDPHAALDGGPDGLDIIRRLADGAPPLLKPGGFIALEIGIGQSSATAQILASAGFNNIQIEKDFRESTELLQETCPRLNRVRGL